MPALPLFTTATVAFTAVIMYYSDYLFVFTSPYTYYTGLVLLALSSVLYLWQKVRFHWAYDIFALACFIIWYALWHTQFRAFAPMFYAIPVLFSLSALTISFIVLKKHSLFSEQERVIVGWLCKQPLFKPWMLAAIVLFSLWNPTYYLLYPFVMLLLLLRYTFEEANTIE